MEYNVGEIISYPVPGVCVDEFYKNTVDKKAKIIKVYENISDNGVIVDMEILDGSVKGTLSGKLLNNKKPQR